MDKPHKVHISEDDFKLVFFILSATDPDDFEAQDVKALIYKARVAVDKSEAGQKIQLIPDF